MVTRSQSDIVKPIERLSLHTSSLSPIPKSPFIALKDPNWCNAMYDEYNALVKNGTWILVPRPSNQHDVDFDETFSPVVKPATIRTVLSLAVSRQWPIHQLDVKNAFLNIDLSKTVYMHQPPGFVDSRYPNHDPTLYRSLARGLQYLTFTRLNLSYAFQQICLYMHDPREPHFATLKRILLYVQGTLELGLHLYASATTSLVEYIDWAGCPSTRIIEAEYRGVVNVVAETAWLYNLLRKLHSSLLTAILAGHVRVIHVPSRFQNADIFTKGLPSALFEDFRSSLSVHPPPAQTAGA
ncbi:ribonuclease H-like domain-containing protein [Tanacetum coccineum]